FKHRASEMAELVIESKRLALSNEPPDKILDLIAQKLEGGPLGSVERREDSAAPEPATTAAALSAIERNAAVQR
ncbi:MAG TPA: hypothetical protein VD966_13335, partial [Pyrinomonadaceae bacterium]|nr:hypothetical protein [Pyrinomonadaceae bacterium]